MCLEDEAELFASRTVVCDGAHGASRGIVLLSLAVAYEELLRCRTMNPARCA